MHVLSSAVQRRSRLHKALIAAVALIGVVAGAVALFVTSSGRSAHTPSAQSQRSQGAPWMTAALTDFTPMKGVLVAFVKTLSDWQDGHASSAAAAGQVDHALPEFLATRDALARRAPLASAPRALDDYRRAVALYIEAAQMAKVATGLPDGALQHQLKLSYARLRNLADRVFDQSAVELAPYLPVPPSLEGIEIQKPAEVPLWASLGLAAGPPLDIAPPLAPHRAYQATRPHEPFASWANDVQRAGVPSAADVASAITSGSTAALRALSDRLTAASERVQASADPTGERVVSTRVQLGLLVDAEGTRAAEAATLVTGTARQQLGTLAQRLTALGDGLWDERLGARRS
jgi:hypothetical protein